MDLTGKVILVTGGARRIGAAIVRALAHAGADVAIHYNKSRREAESLADEVIRQCGVRAWAIPQNFAETGGGEALFDKTLECTGGTLDAIVNSASEYARSGDEAACARARQIGVLAPIALTMRLAALRDAPKAVVNILDARIAGGDDSDHPQYLAAKKELAVESRSLALTLAPHLRLNSIAPGAVLEEDGKDRESLLRLKDFNPMRTVGSPEGLAECVLFLLRQDFIAGQTIFYDGGRHLRE